MKTLTTLGLAAGLTIAAGVSASALTLTVVGAECDPAAGAVNGVLPLALDCGTTTARQDSSNVNLGAADGHFYSLGLDSSGGAFGGIIALRIDPAFTGPALIAEVTNPSTHWEAAVVLVGTTDDYSAATVVGTVNNGKGGSEAATSSVTITGVWNYMFLVDASRAVYAGTQTVDGFDLDSITVSAVPLPAGALLLGTALVGLGFSRRRG